jgi:SAM-dependent methyltransferase
VAEALGGVRSILQLPAVFRLFTCLVGGPRARAEFVRRYVRPCPGDRVVDIGCGTGELVEFLPETDYVGFDASEEYVQAARSRHGGRGRFVHGRVGSSPLASEAPFDLAIAFGVLHHLDDAQADHLFAEARRLLRGNGRLVTYDGCWVEGQSRIARWLISMDRGQAVRAPRELARLAAPHFPDVRAEIRHDFLRIPYTHVVLECSNMRTSPPPAT